MPHNAEARREAAAMPLVLFGDYGRTVEGYRPADMDLEQAAQPQSHRRGDTITGPHLRTARERYARNRTGIVGISIGFDRFKGHRYVYVNLGSTNRKFNADALGLTEAFRRAMALRAEHLKKLAQANALILQARARTADGKGGAL